MTTARPTDTQSQLFGPLVIHYDERVLTPRPWTLLQSLWAAELAERAAAGPILELFAGAGQIGLAAAVLTGRSLVQVEADPVAAGYAQANAATAGCDQQVDVRNDRVQTALAAGERFPIILADPPYLPTASIGRWPHDPVAAIDGGADGLDLTRVCLKVASDHLARRGALLLQVAGESQAREVVSHLAAHDDLYLTHLETRTHDSARAVMLLVSGA